MPSRAVYKAHNSKSAKEDQHQCIFVYKKLYRPGSEPTSSQSGIAIFINGDISDCSIADYPARLRVYITYVQSPTIRQAIMAMIRHDYMSTICIVGLRAMKASAVNLPA